jgi:predicted membrane channel-forming protein YqfA (hemolysin III family)
LSKLEDSKPILQITLIQKFLRFPMAIELAPLSTYSIERYSSQQIIQVVVILFLMAVFLMMYSSLQYHLYLNLLA